jgi:hypothetical protein
VSDAEIAESSLHGLFRAKEISSVDHNGILEQMPDSLQVDFGKVMRIIVYVFQESALALSPVGCVSGSIRMRDAGLCGGRYFGRHVGTISTIVYQGQPIFLPLNLPPSVDINVARFLNSCEEQGGTLLHCPAYIREWMRIEQYLEWHS